MGLIGSLLTLPVTGPARAGFWVVDQVVAAAEAELYDEGRIVAELRALAAEADAGRITEEEHAAAEEVLLERLMEARARRAHSQETP
ncbi:gas vesicle protein [Egibacter rhizosphaerae]|uniref:Gas vesicle protein n=1 Tax=Egibacter rhizosphaerae TaxID=1670831 RepID=A0A411YC07_9ACTN|nr:gas vesicle protein GvpG [Egibacter rhizosphaerae]QBI18687.1 gas vesicle protein [Egibacter rhizosphaerae]